jgi:hypothetical protein
MFSLPRDEANVVQCISMQLREMALVPVRSQTYAIDTLRQAAETLTKIAAEIEAGGERDATNQDNG